MTTPRTVFVGPQPGPQEQFLASPADIAIYGGGAGGGKTFALLLEPLRHVANPAFGAVFFRRTTVQIRNEGGLWDESMKLYPDIGGDPKEHNLTWKFPSGATISFAHLEHDKTRFNWQGSQIPLQCFDELTHFSETQFWYLLSRNRSMCGVRPYVRATCNPDASSWVAKFISWWIDPESGLPIKERAGKLRWFVRIGNDLIWADTPEDLHGYTMPGEDGEDAPIPPKSVTFIPALLTDNKAMMRADPGYMANLLALSTVERERLLGGNWKIMPASGLYFKREQFKLETQYPEGTRWLRGWDLAATESENAAWTVGVLMGRCPEGRVFIRDVRRVQASSYNVEKLLRETAAADVKMVGPLVQGSIPQDPGQAGKAQAAYLIRQLAGFNYGATPESGDKTTRALPFSAQVQAGNVYLLPGDWHNAYTEELEQFPDGKWVDQVDASSRAFNALFARKRSMLEVAA